MGLNSKISFKSKAYYLTANARLTRSLMQAFQQSLNQTDSDYKPQATPRIQPLSSWLEDIYQQQSSCSDSILKPFEERCIWQDIISKTSGNLLAPKQTATNVQQAFQILHYWQVPLTTIEAETEEIQQFKAWAKSFEEICRDKHWISTSQVPAKILSLLQNQNKAIKFNQPIYFIGFDDLPPIFESLRKTLTAEMLTAFEPPVNPEVQKHAFQNNQDEITAMAIWAKTGQDQNPNQRIACVVPNLTELRPEIQKTFQKIFHPEFLLTGIADNQPKFNISAGLNLSEYPLIQAGTSILRLQHKINIYDVRELLTSPFMSLTINTTIQSDFASLIYQQLLDQEQIEISAKHLSRLITTLAAELQIELHRPAKELFQSSLDISGSRSPSKWLATFVERLKIWGWPGARKLDSTEFQLYTRFAELLQSFNQLDKLYPNISYAKAVSLLSQLINDSPFQPESNPEAVQILGLLEANAARFDKIWIMNLTNRQLPAAAKPNPFLPYQLQADQQMPHATADREYDYAAKLMQRLLNAAEEVHVSFPSNEGDQPLMPSPFIEAFALSETNHLETIEKTNKPKLDIIHDAELPLDDSESFSTGAQLFKLQAACPFRSFASLRLKAKTEQPLQVGFPAKLHGILVHRVLQTFWQQTKTQTGLLALDDQFIEALVGKLIIDAFEKYYLDPLAFYHKIEIDRLQSLIMKWLALEKQREAFEVKALEQEKIILIDNTPVKLQIDRIDKLTGNREVVIDYKTGITRIYDWLGERPADPQMPLYNTALGPDCEGLLYAELRAGSLRFKGIVDASIDITGATPLAKVRLNDMPRTWKDLSQAWEKVLINLMKDFKSGNVEVDPLDEKLTCQYCTLQSLCRITEKDAA